ncbi:MAG: ATP-binding protein [Actinomycetota bacterium]|nr:ATP-binding protein [Actinomycetota bacterium]
MLPTQPDVTGQWLFSQEAWRFVVTDWPHFIFSGSVGSNPSYDLTQPLQASGQPYFASLSAAIAECVFTAPANQMERAQAHQVLVRIADRRGRIDAIDISEGNVSVVVATDREDGLKGFVLRSAWRRESAEVAWERHDEENLSDRTVRLVTNGVPAEFVVTLVAPDGQQVDLRSWDERFGRPEEEKQPGALDGLVSRWLAEGEHEQLEYKLELNENQTRTSFAETVAAFANGAGGTILVGVADDGTPVGYTATKGADQITNIIGNLVTDPPQLTIEQTEIDHKPILVVRIRPSPPHIRPHQVKGRVMVRTWGTTRAATPAQLRQMLVA